MWQSSHPTLTLLVTRIAREWVAARWTVSSAPNAACCCQHQISQRSGARVEPPLTGEAKKIISTCSGNTPFIVSYQYEDWGGVRFFFFMQEGKHLFRLQMWLKKESHLKKIISWCTKISCVWSTFGCLLQFYPSCRNVEVVIELLVVYINVIHW